MTLIKWISSSCKISLDEPRKCKLAKRTLVTAHQVNAISTCQQPVVKLMNDITWWKT